MLLCYRQLKIATLTSTKLKEEVLSVKKDLDEKTRQYDSMVKCFSELKSELNNTESKLNDLLKENVSLRKRIDEAREWMQTRVGKERNEKINAAQFREIQRSRELSNLKKKSEEDFSTIAQLRGKCVFKLLQFRTIIWKFTSKIKIKKSKECCVRF